MFISKAYYLTAASYIFLAGNSGLLKIPQDEIKTANSLQVVPVNNSNYLHEKQTPCFVSGSHICRIINDPLNSSQHSQNLLTQFSLYYFLTTTFWFSGCWHFREFCVLQNLRKNENVAHHGHRFRRRWAHMAGMSQQKITPPAPEMHYGSSNV